MKKQPAITIPTEVPFPELQSIRSANGVDINTLFVEGEVARVSFAFRAGTSLQQRAFAASATANLLGEGSVGFSSKEIADKLDFYGSYYGVSVDRDWAVATFCCLSKFFVQTMDIAREVLLHPTFEQEEVESYRAKRKQGLLQERSKPAYVARELLSETLFGPTHPYGMNSPAELYDTLTREDILRFYGSFYLADDCFVVASGNIGQQELAVIDSIVSGLPTRDFAEPDLHPAPVGQRFGFVERPGALQSALRLGLVLFPRTHPDYIPMQIVAAALGGYFSSRLVRNLREERGYTYGAYAAMVNLQQSGYLAISTEVATEVTDDALAQIYYEIGRMRDQPPGKEELRTVKNILVGEVMRIIDGPFGVADVAIENIQNAQDNDYVARLVARIKDFTADEFQAVAQKYLIPENFVTVSVGAKKPEMME